MQQSDKTQTSSSRFAATLPLATTFALLVAFGGPSVPMAEALKMPQIKMPQMTNPFKKTHDESLDKPPPGMTEVDEASTSQTDKTLAAPDDEKTHAERQRNLLQSSPDERFDLADGDPELHYKQAKALVAKKQYKEALNEVNECLKLSKNFYEARYLGAYIYQLEGRTAEAITRYRQFLKVRPDNEQAHINLGVCLRKEGIIDEAEEEYRKAIDLHYFSLQGHYDLANLLIDKGNLQDALKELRACEKIAPTNAWVHNNMGVIFQRRSYLEEAEQEFTKAANLEPANKTFTQNLSMVRDQLARKRGARATAQKLM